TWLKPPYSSSEWCSSYLRMMPLLYASICLFTLPSSSTSKYHHEQPQESYWSPRDSFQNRLILGSAGLSSPPRGKRRHPCQKGNEQCQISRITLAKNANHAAIWPAR